MELPEAGCRVCGIHFMNLQAKGAGSIDSVLLHHFGYQCKAASGNLCQHAAQQVFGDHC